MVDSGLSRYREILQQKEALFQAGVENGDISPFIFPRDFVPLFALIITLSIKRPKHGLLRYARYLVFLGICCVSFERMTTCRMLGFGNGYAVGLYNAWLVVWAAALLVYNDPEKDFRRIERYLVPSHECNDSKPVQNGSAVASGSSKGQPSNSRHRALPDSASCPPSCSSKKGETTSMRITRWQGHPESISHRIWWVLDLVSNFRGPGWSWSIRGLSPRPDSVPSKKDDILTEPDAPNKARNDKLASHLRSISLQFVLSYLALDILKVTMMLDPFFRGELPSVRSPPLGQILSISDLFTWIYRLVMSALGVLSALFFAPSMLFLLYLGFSILVPQAQTWFSVPLEAPWMYPQWFGSIPDFIDHGLIGFWGRGWHQFFRFGFAETCNWIITHLPAKFQGKTTKRIIQLFIAFSVSGSLHACGSYTMMSDTEPLFPFLFFLSQAPGILFQKSLGEVIHWMLPLKAPGWLRRAGNMCFLAIWFLFVSGLFVDDVARGGVWLLEPVPFSLIRGLGFLGPHEGWWCWNAKWFRWQSGERWWDSGVQIL